MKVTYAKGSVSPEDIVKYLNLTNQFIDVSMEVVVRKHLVAHAKDMGITVTDEELQEFADKYRRKNFLWHAGHTDDFLKGAGLSREDFLEFCLSSLLYERAKDKVADRQTVEKYFNEDKNKYHLVVLSQLVVGSEEEARSIRERIGSDPGDFHSMARKYANDAQAKFSGGYVGVRTPEAFPASIAAKLRTSKKGEILGPFGEDGSYYLYLVEDVIPPDLDNELVEATVKEEIFDDWKMDLVGGSISVTK